MLVARVLVDEALAAEGAGELLNKRGRELLASGSAGVLLDMGRVSSARCTRRVFGGGVLVEGQLAGEVAGTSVAVREQRRCWCRTWNDCRQEGWDVGQRGRVSLRGVSGSFLHLKVWLNYPHNAHQCPSGIRSDGQVNSDGSADRGRR